LEPRRNDYDKDVYNGDRGVVSGIDVEEGEDETLILERSVIPEGRPMRLPVKVSFPVEAGNAGREEGRL
jgi:ATP-dependent exoDNAse (exonuclease V) alpha subunit